MDIKKFEKLIDLVINEDNEKANELFHEICVEKSREIFESILAEDDMEDDSVEEGMGGQAGQLMDEITADETEEGMYEEEDDLDFGDEEVEFGSDDEEGDEGGEEIEDAVVRIEDKLDQLMAEFEEIMGGGDDDFGGEEGDEEEMDFGGEEDDEEMMEGDAEEMDEDDSVMEAVALKKVSVTHGDNGVQTKSPNTNNSGQAGMDSHPVKFSGDAETVPTGPKAGQVKDLKGAGSFKNSPGKDNFKDKGEAAPKPKHGDDGANTKSPVAESRRSARRPIR